MTQSGPEGVSLAVAVLLLAHNVTSFSKPWFCSLEVEFLYTTKTWVVRHDPDADGC